MALAGAACLTWLAASLSPTPRMGAGRAAVHAPETPPEPALMPPEADAAARPAWQPGTAPATADPTPAPTAPGVPRGRSYKCVEDGQVSCSDRPCGPGADSSLVNVRPALDGAVPVRR